MLKNVGNFFYCLIFDNNRINRNKLTQTYNGELQPNIEHSLDAEIFFMFDSVHLMKCIRNYWLGQLDTNHTSLCPGLQMNVIIQHHLQRYITYVTMERITQ